MKLLVFIAISLVYFISRLAAAEIESIYEPQKTGYATFVQAKPK